MLLVITNFTPREGCPGSALDTSSAQLACLGLNWRHSKGGGGGDTLPLEKATSGEGKWTFSSLWQDT